jgi:hypothetical protein
MNAIRRNWMAGLVAVLAVLYAYVGILSRGAVAIAGVGGAVLIAISLLDLGLPRWGREAMILVGALPLAALTWWSLVTPVLAALVIAIGSVAARRRAADTSPLQADNGTEARG